MNKVYTLLALVLIGISASAQSDKQVKWNFTAKKLSDKVFELHMTATINGDYHMYAQNAGVEGPLPTTFKFTGNPLVAIEGKTKEVGKMVRKKEDVWGGTVNYYENSVDFVQVVKLKGNIKTNVAGSVEFIVCNEVQCLPPSEVQFKVNIGG